MTRRALDLVLGAPALLVAAPLILILGLAVRLGSPGPAFFVQWRVGRHRRPIRVVKLRTMVRDAERLGSQVTAAHDPRVTPLGRLLRASKLDELPQLWNVVRGDMSLVGPRPEVERYIDALPPAGERLFGVRPGVTGSASIAFRDEERLLEGVADRERAYREIVLPAKVEVALQDVDDQSLVHDLAILTRTVLAVLGMVPPHPAFERVRVHLAGGVGATRPPAGQAS